MAITRWDELGHAPSTRDKITSQVIAIHYPRIEEYNYYHLTKKYL
jgi:hypothetical protein